jgi:hypothetical protein
LKSLLFALAVAALTLRGGDLGTLPPIAPYTHFAELPPAAVVDGLQREGQSIMAPVGSRFQWLELAASDGKQVAVELAVMEFKGHCDVTGLLPHDSNPGPLGWTHLSEGVILPFAMVDCSAVRTFIQRELMNLPDAGEAFGGALGRVLAHEAYHVFANTAQHGSAA